MIEEKIVIDFDEYLSYFDDTGEVRDVANAQCCIDAINKAVNDFLSGATTVAHHGFNIHGKNFHVSVEVKPSDDDDYDDLVSLNISDACGGSAEFCFDATRQLVMTKTYNCVHIG